MVFYLIVNKIAVYEKFFTIYASPMQAKKVFFKNFEEVVSTIKRREALFCSGSMTSTVLPYSTLSETLGEKNITWGDLSNLPKNIELTNDSYVKVEGSVSWSELTQFLKNYKRKPMVTPTEKLALVTAGVATSATGDRSFMFGPLKKQVENITYLNFQGETVKLSKNVSLNHFFEQEDERKILEAYQAEGKIYADFKNPPFPRMEKEIDLMVGTEGQLGIIKSVELKTLADFNLKYFYIELPRWEENFEYHLTILHKVQHLKESLFSVEFLDSNSLKYLPTEFDNLKSKKCDLLFLEILEEQFETVYEQLFVELQEQSLTEIIYAISEEKYLLIRNLVPLKINETFQRQKIQKIGTDVQVKTKNFKDLLTFYRLAQNLDIPYALFGHFGDAHLHLNLIPNTQNEVQKCEAYLAELYDRVLTWQGSPFAEHGIGLKKQQYIKPFHSETQKKMFALLKKKFDPYNQFFPLGFMHG